MFFRARHAGHRGASLDERLGLALHITFNAVNKSWQRENADHVIFCMEGRSWRRDVYKSYKRNRQVIKEGLTNSERAENELFMEVFNDMAEFLNTRTNCSVLQNSIAEADDLIARFVALHEADQHVIVSSDSDFLQLIAENVCQYNGMSDQLITLEGYFDYRGNPVIDKKTKLPKVAPDPEWLLFEKCIRGDATDNIFSAYPGVRKKGSKNKVGLLDAYKDRHNKGYVWNNLMLQRWTDHNDVEHIVSEDFQRNKQLIDLAAQPGPVKDNIDTTILSLETKSNPQIGLRFMKFCGQHDLIKLSEYATQHADWLSAKYKQGTNG